MTERNHFFFAVLNFTSTNLIKNFIKEKGPLIRIEELLKSKNFDFNLSCRKGLKATANRNYFNI